MIFNVICLLMIMLITLYLATQGMTSALIALITSVFASLLAMGLMEPLQGLIGGYRPDFARGCTFLLIFVLTFSGTRIAADMMVPKNIKLPSLINRLAGGFAGFFTAMVVVGTTIIGIEMLPLGTSLLGYDRFGSETRMQGEGVGNVAGGNSAWLAPERFTLALWRGASGRGLGGAESFADIHPDIDVESYGYRNTIQYGSNHSLPPELFEVKAGWVSSEPRDYQSLGIPIAESGKKIVMIRTAVTRGASPKTAADSDDNFRMTPTQIRMVAGTANGDKVHQYFPIGVLDGGRKFQPLSLDAGQLVEDFIKGIVYEDWIFEINDDESPRFVEMKQTARSKEGELAGIVKDKPTKPLAAADYPQKPYLKLRSNLSVTLSGRGTVIEGKVYILETAAGSKDMQTQVDAAYDVVLDALGDKSGTPWPTLGTPGVPNRGTLSQAVRIGQDIKNAQNGVPTQWSRALQLIMLGPMKPTAASSLASYPPFVDKEVVPMLNACSTGSAILTSGMTKDPSGKVELRDIPQGAHCILATLKTDTAFYFWIQDVEFKAKIDKTLDLSAANAADPKIEP